MGTDLMNKVQVVLSDDYMRGYIFIDDDRENPDQLHEDIMDALRQRGIVYGISDSLIDEICNHNMPAINLLIAEGTPPVNGIDGSYRYFYEDNHRLLPKINEDGSVDYKNIEYFNTVYQGDILMEIIPATDGSKGMNVKGEEIPALSGLACDIKVGLNCYVKGHKVYANVDGLVSFDGRCIEVSNLLEISDDIGVGTGNIVFTGDVKVKGDVQFGMSVKCHNLSVDGVIEGASVVVKGDLMVGKGIVGQECTDIQCEGNLTCKYMHSANVHVDGDIHADMIVNCQTFCGGKILLDGKKGTIIGGTTTLKKRLQAKSIGSELGVTTVFKLGEITNILNQIRDTERDIDEYNQIYKKTEQCILVLKQKLDKNPQHKKYRTLSAEYTRNKFTVQHKINLMNQSLLKLHNQLTESGVIELSVGTLHPGALFYSGKNEKHIQDPRNNIMLKSIHGEIMILDA